MRILRFLGLVLLLFSTAHGENINLHRDQWNFGPAWSYVFRNKQQGTSQKGNLYGFQLKFDHLHRFKWYYGLDLSYLRGVTRGSSSTIGVRSLMFDFDIEGRFGYTFQRKTKREFSITPFVGLGYIEEKNNFTHPTFFPVHFETYFSYLTTGALLWLHPCRLWDIGFDAKVKLPISPKCKVTHDPENLPVTQRIGERAGFRLDLPVTYRYTDKLTLKINPFYEYRHYGYRMNYPFDFIDTRVKFVGCILGLQIRL